MNGGNQPTKQIDLEAMTGAGNVAWAEAPPNPLNQIDPDEVVAFATEAAEPEPGEGQEAAEPETEATAPAEPEAAQDGSEPDKEGSERIAKLARDNRELKRRLREKELEAAAAQGDQNAASAVAQQAHAKKTGAIIDAGRDEFGVKAFDQASQAVADDFGPAVGLFIEALHELPDSHKVIMHLAANPDIAEAIAVMPPHRMGAALAREAAKLAPKPKAISKAPAPIKPIAVAKSAPAQKQEKDMSMAELMAITREQYKAGRGRVH